MANSPNLALPYIDQNQSQKHVTHNAAIRELDAIVQLSVIDDSLTAPPGSPADGDRYIVAGGATGAWTGKAGKIAAWQDGAWNFFAPKNGWLAWVASRSELRLWPGASWISVGAELGTSGHKIPYLDAANTWSAQQSFSSSINLLDKTNGYRIENNIVLSANAAYGALSIGSPTAAVWMAGLSASSNTVAIGLGSLGLNGSGVNNVAAGAFTLASNTSGHDNVAIGNYAGYFNTTGFFNTAVGGGAVFNNTTGLEIIGIGFNASAGNVGGAFNIGIGNASLNVSQNDTQNVGIGHHAMYLMNGGSYNTCVGNNSLSVLLSGSYNSVLGYNSGLGLTTGSNNTILGANVTGLPSGLSNSIILATGDGVIQADYGRTASNIWALKGHSLIAATEAHGAALRLGVLESTVTLSGPTTDAAVQIPANCIVLGVSNRVITAIEGATSYDCGDVGGVANRFGGTLGVALGSTNFGLIGPNPYYSPTSVRFTANGGNFTGGVVRMAIYYLSYDVSTS
jgi:hypothetical protein